MFAQLSNWFQKYKKYFFRYRNGFYELPYFANSPQTVNAGYTDAPFIKCDTVNNRFSVNNVFVKAVTRFYEVEEGLWIYFVNMEHKKKIKFTPVYNEKITDNYYMFSLTEMRDNFKLKVRNVRKECYVEKNFWTLFKPLHNPDYLNNKNSSGHCITVFFNDAWLEKSFYSVPEWQHGHAIDFLKSDKTLVSWPETGTNSLEKTFDFTAMLQKNAHEINETQVKKYADNLIQHFFTALNNATNCNYFELSDADRDKLFAIEKYLLDRLDEDFIGIEFLSNQFGISPTKLKNDFKTQYGTTIFQFFREKQMQLAEQLIKTKDYSIKDIAQKMGYENAGKFSVAFKECRGVSPSQV